jgi:hypothetical protein
LWGRELAQKATLESGKEKKRKKIQRQYFVSNSSFGGSKKNNLPNEFRLKM